MDILLNIRKRVSMPRPCSPTCKTPAPDDTSRTGFAADIGVDGQTGLTHSAVVTVANVHDKHPIPELLHGNEQRMYSDSAYASQKELITSKVPKAKGFTNERVRNRSGEVDEVKRANTVNFQNCLTPTRKGIHPFMADDRHIAPKGWQDETEQQ